MSNLNPGDSKADSFASLDEVCSLLQTHPGFRELPVTRIAKSRRADIAIGRFIKSVRMLTFGAEFARALTLLHYQIRREQPRLLALDFRWHVKSIHDDWSVFVHFVDDGGAILFQGDYPLQGETPDPLGFIHSRRMVVVPAGIPAGDYHVRLGVWSPGSASHLHLTRFRGCQRDPADLWRNAVRLASLTI